MKLFAMGVALIVTIALTGCGNTNNYYTDPAAVPEVGSNAGTANCPQCTTQNRCSDCAYGYMSNAQFPVVPVAIPQATQIVTSYEEVYATEYTPNGPVVKKQLVPIKSTVPVVAQPMFMNTAASYGLPIVPTQQLPVVIGTPPAQPVNPSIQEPVAWFGPTAAPNYSTQTNWF